MPAVHFPLLFELLRTLQKYLFLPLLNGKIMVEIWTVKTISKLRQPSFRLFLFHKRCVWLGRLGLVLGLFFVWDFLRARKKRLILFLCQNQDIFINELKQSIILKHDAKREWAKTVSYFIISAKKPTVIIKAMQKQSSPVGTRDDIISCLISKALNSYGAQIYHLGFQKN